MGSGRPDGGGSSSSSSSKERLKWTQELHEAFERSVNQLGGPDRATPKGILRAMGVRGLTIFHVKSHLQKYRMLKLVPESSSKGKYEKKMVSEILPNFSVTSGAQLNEALQLYEQIQSRLNDRNQVEESLKMKTEVQRRYLDRITNENRVSGDGRESENEEDEAGGKRRKIVEVPTITFPETDQSSLSWSSAVSACQSPFSWSSALSACQSPFSWSSALSACQSPFLLPSLFNSFI